MKVALGRRRGDGGRAGGSRAAAVVASHGGGGGGGGEARLCFERRVRAGLRRNGRQVGAASCRENHYEVSVI